MITPPFSFFGVYGWTVIVKQISISFLLYSYLVPAVIAVAFGIFIAIKTKQVSGFYLFLICISFALYCLFDLVAWAPNPDIVMFSWSVLDVLSVSFFILSYWFLYSFVKEHDLPLWQKVLTSLAIVPTFFITALSINMFIFNEVQFTAVENQSVTNYNSILYTFFILVIVAFTIFQYYYATDRSLKNKIALAGAGTTIFLCVYCAVLIITNLVFLFNIPGLASSDYIYTIDSYSVFGMPILLGFLSYLIAKYQAFDIKLIRSIVYMVILMILLFIGLFFT